MSSSDRIFTYRGASDISYKVNIGPGKEFDFSPIILNPYFSRLRYKGQLKPIDLIVSGAVHSRLEHSLGVLGLAKMIIGNPNVVMNDYGKFLFLTGSLDHDIGHGPYSHIYDIVSAAHGGKTHKMKSIDIIEKMEDAIKQSAGKIIPTNHLVEDLIDMIKNDRPLYKLIVDKDRLDKWDYVVRDFHYCQSGSVPDIETLANNLYFDGEKSAIHVSARDALRAFLEAYINNNTSIYMREEVEICEGLLIRAIESCVENGFDIEKGWELVDEELNRELESHPVSRDLFRKIRENNFTEGSLWVPAACIKPKGLAG